MNPNVMKLLSDYESFCITTSSESKQEEINKLLQINEFEKREGQWISNWSSIHFNFIGNEKFPKCISYGGIGKNKITFEILKSYLEKPITQAFKMFFEEE